VALDQLLWRPVVVWDQKFRVEEGGAQIPMSSWFLSWLRRSRALARLRGALASWRLRRSTGVPVSPRRKPQPVSTSRLGTWLSLTALSGLIVLLLYGGWQLLLLLGQVKRGEWADIGGAAGVTLGRVLLSTMIGTLWALPAGLAIGLSPRLSRLLQPLIQVVASFPAPMLYPLVIAGLLWAGVSLGAGSILLMLLGTQWYILFNVIAGAMAIPADLREAATSYRVMGWRRFWTLYLPCVFPHLVTGWVTAAGGAWNASILSEFVIFKRETLSTVGLGSLIQRATKELDPATGQPHFPLLAASVLVMAAVVVLFNRTVWRRLYLLAEERFSLNK